MLTAIIIAKNEEKMIHPCINSCRQLAQEIIVIDNNSEDRTHEVSENAGAQVIFSDATDFSVLRNLGLEKSSGDWILYVDADERVTKALASEINKIFSSPATLQDGYILNREDYYFGTRRPLFSPMHRLFKKSSLKGWSGPLHETPQVEGTVGILHQPLLHFTHCDINSMLTNTIPWSDKEALLRFEAGHPPVVWWRLIRVFITGFYNSFITQRGYKCKTAGWIEALYQGCSMYITYAKLWELQNKEFIKSSYQKLDEEFKS